MALHIRTDIQNIRENIDRLIADCVVRTWKVDDDGDYEFIASQWEGKAWIRFRGNSNGDVVFGIVEAREEPLTKVLYAIYMTRFAEMLLTHFDNVITEMRITPLLERNIDIYKETIN